jgi:uncharacterized protein (DUF362 family)
MTPGTAPPCVILRHCDRYDAGRVRTIVREGLEQLGLAPAGRTLVKPNLVAAGRMFAHAHTRPEVAEGVLRALREVGGDAITELAVGERCGITIPTRSAFRQSGFDAMMIRVTGVVRYPFEEVTQVEVRQTHDGRLRDSVFVAEPIVRADFFVNVPKFKAHPWTTVTFSLKNYIGIQDDRHRLIDHDARLNEKVADLQHVVQPQLVVVDAITAGQGRMLTPRPFPLHLIVLGNNQVAVDAVCCAVIGLEARSVEHIRLAESRGFGPAEIGRIAISGDVSLAEAQARAKGFEVGLVRVEKYFEGTHITAYAGPPPEIERKDYCWGGCPGAIEEAIEILRAFDEACDEKMPRLHVVFGAYDGPIDAGPGERVVFIGDCAAWKGRVGGEDVSVESVYKNRATRDPHTARPDDLYLKMIRIFARLTAARRRRWFRLGGCPVSVAEQVLALTWLAGTKNPYFDPREVIDFNRGYVGWRAATLLRRLRGLPYQRPDTGSGGVPETGPRR